MEISGLCQKEQKFTSDLKRRDERYTTQNISDLDVDGLSRLTFKIFIGFLDENIFLKNRDVGLAVAHYFVGFLNHFFCVENKINKQSYDFLEVHVFVETHPLRFRTTVRGS